MTETKEATVKLTLAQKNALQVIADNPGRVEAVTRIAGDWLRINGNTERKLCELGLITKSVEAREIMRIVQGWMRRDPAYFWVLTDAGRAAIV